MIHTSRVVRLQVGPRFFTHAIQAPSGDQSGPELRTLSAAASKVRRETAAVVASTTSTSPGAGLAREATVRRAPSGDHDASMFDASKPSLVRTSPDPSALTK